MWIPCRTIGRSLFIAEGLLSLSGVLASKLVSFLLVKNIQLRGVFYDLNLLYGGVCSAGACSGLQNQRGAQQSPRWVRFPSTSARSFPISPGPRPRSRMRNIQHWTRHFRPRTIRPRAVDSSLNIQCWRLEVKGFRPQTGSGSPGATA